MKTSCSGAFATNGRLYRDILVKRLLIYSSACWRKTPGRGYPLTKSLCTLFFRYNSLWYPFKVDIMIWYATIIQNVERWKTLHCYVLKFNTRIGYATNLYSPLDSKNACSLVIKWHSYSAAFALGSIGEETIGTAVQARTRSHSGYKILRYGIHDWTSKAHASARADLDFDGSRCFPWILLYKSERDRLICDSWMECVY